MATPDLSCPVCSAYLPLAGDERPGDDVYCTYCGTPGILRKSDTNPETFEVEDDL